MERWELRTHRCPICATGIEPQSNWHQRVRLQPLGGPSAQSNARPAQQQPLPLAHVDWLPSHRPDGAAGQPAARPSAACLAGPAAGWQGSPRGPLSSASAGEKRICGTCNGMWHRCGVPPPLPPPPPAATYPPCCRFAGTLCPTPTHLRCSSWPLASALQPAQRSRWWRQRRRQQHLRRASRAPRLSCSCTTR